MHKPSQYQICTRCVMDTSDPDIRFDESGVCSHCYSYDHTIRKYPYNLTIEEKNTALEQIIKKIKADGEGKEYDCVIGLSGGVDSSYLAYLTVRKFGLRPLAVHLDNGWDTELSINNIENICNRLGIVLDTYVIDWEEFRDLQLAFLKASTPDTEVITDHAIVTLFYTVPLKYGIKYFLSGANFATESTSVPAWSQGHNDWIYIKTVHQTFGTKKLETFPHYDRLQLYSWRKKGVEIIQVLDYVEYHKTEAKKILQEEIGWRDYGGKHFESFFTKFFQAYILPEKFGFDKRKMHLTSLIHSGQVTRGEALSELSLPSYNESDIRSDIDYVLKNFQLSLDEFNDIMSHPQKTYHDYGNASSYVPYRILNHIITWIIHPLLFIPKKIRILAKRNRNEK